MFIGSMRPSSSEVGALSISPYSSPLGDLGRLGSRRGPDSARIMVIGEAYGAEESRLSAPFVGPSGRLLSELLAAVGIDPTPSTTQTWSTSVHLPMTFANGQPMQDYPTGPLLDGLVESQTRN
jgi:hypothetical protein